MTCLGDQLVAVAAADLGNPTDFNMPGAFCSIAIQTWLQKASAQSGQTSPIVGSAGAKATMAQLQAKGLWISVSTLRESPGAVQAGMLAVWRRGEPGACTGHIGVVTSGVAGDSFQTIEANAAPTVGRFTRALSADNLLGMGWFPCATQESPLDRARSGSWVVPTAVAVAVAGISYWALTRKGKR
jgi:hypothetical protein